MSDVGKRKGFRVGTTALLEVREISKTFQVRTSFGGPLRRAEVLRSVSLQIPDGSSVAVVGESGSGKTTLARCILGLEKPDTGEVLLKGDRLASSVSKRDPEILGRIQPVFQDAPSSLSPRRTVEDALMQPLRAAEAGPSSIDTLLGQVGLPADLRYRFRHELSGGQLQRVAIARALASNPDLIIADEPTSALDVSVQAQVLSYLDQVRRDSGLSLLLITHNLAVVRSLCQYVYVMYMGEVVEGGPTEQLFGDPQHPYTRVLLSAIPSLVLSAPPAPPAGMLDIPSIFDRPKGCPFRTRCSEADDICSSIPPRVEIGQARWVSCHMRQPQGSDGCDLPSASSPARGPLHGT